MSRKSQRYKRRFELERRRCAALEEFSKWLLGRPWLGSTSVTLLFAEDQLRFEFPRATIESFDFVERIGQCRLVIKIFGRAALEVTKP